MKYITNMIDATIEIIKESFEEILIRFITKIVLYYNAKII
tara:strand:+ start:454 stop:573 length:120 start_codon:yes stop_codon:yes gene_type:complete